MKKGLLSKLKATYILLFKGKKAYARYIGVTIGNNCRIYTRYWGSEPFLIRIGNNVTIVEGVRFVTHDGSTWLMRDEKGRRYYYASIIIGNNVFIGINSVIMPGVKIEDRVIVAAGSIVTKSIPSDSVVAGNPAKNIGSYEELKERVLKNYISEKDVDPEWSYKERIYKSLTKEFKPYIRKWEES